VAVNRRLVYIAAHPVRSWRFLKACRAPWLPLPTPTNGEVAA
jgi:hypothetical protein